jgi:hypothetical protein
LIGPNFEATDAFREIPTLRRQRSHVRILPGAPIIALDDIVTSYDADHRRTVAGLLATIFGDCQILITTHDERFFNYLKDQLEAKAWHFTRIIGVDPTYGPQCRPPDQRRDDPGPMGDRSVGSQ